MLDRDEMELVEALQFNKGFSLLLESITAEIDCIADQMDRSQSNTEALRTMALWRAMRRIYTILKTTPHLMTEELENLEKKETSENLTRDMEAYKQWLSWEEKRQVAHLALLKEESE